MTSVHPALPLLLGGLLLTVARGWVQKVLLVVVPVLGLLNVVALDLRDQVLLNLGGFQLELLQVDTLSLLFGYLFHLGALLAGIYSLHHDDRVQHVSGFLYAGSAVGAVFAGDLLTLFLFWELLAVTSAFQIFARRTESSIGAGMRYLLVHVSSGLLLLAGAMLHYQKTGSIDFERMQLVGVAEWLLLLAFGIKCAFPLLHTWLVDGYPASTPTGGVFLCSFTTKAAVYALARGFAGAEVLIWVGAVMTFFPIFYAVIENDLRRVLGYSMINQIGFMVVGIGLGDGMGVNGAVAHAFNDVFFKGLLFMAMGAVLLRTGRINGSELGGLYKTMPWTAGCCMVGAASISAFPLFSGFVSKSMVMVEAANQGHMVVWLVLLFASAGVFHHAGIKIPFFAFFAHDSGLRPAEAPWNMRIAMGLGAAMCIAIGCLPGVLYGFLPFQTDYHPYDATHVLTQLQLLFFSALAFTFLKLTHIYPPELRSTNLDADWTVRRLAPALFGFPVRAAARMWRGGLEVGQAALYTAGSAIGWLHRPSGRLGAPWPTGTTAFWAALLLAAYLLFAYFEQGGR